MSEFVSLGSHNMTITTGTEAYPVAQRVVSHCAGVLPSARLLLGADDRRNPVPSRGGGGCRCGGGEPSGVAGRAPGGRRGLVLLRGLLGRLPLRRSG